MRTIINKVAKAIEENTKSVDKLFENSIAGLLIVSEYDVINSLGISISEFEIIKNASKELTIKEDELKLIMELITKIEKKTSMIKMVNDKIILSGAKVSKTTMQYLIKKGEEKQQQTAIINVYIDEFGTPLVLKDFIEEETKKETGEINVKNK